MNASAASTLSCGWMISPPSLFSSARLTIVKSANAERRCVLAKHTMMTTKQPFDSLVISRACIGSDKPNKVCREISWIEQGKHLLLKGTTTKLVKHNKRVR
jgi:hypothetical protein